MSDRLGVRAITMQQPFAAAMAAGLGLHTRRGKATSFAGGGEWVAIHCGQNDEHMKNAALLAKVRAQWPECPSDEDLRSQQRCILGVARFVDGDVNASAAAKADFFLQNYDCSKPVAWRADAARRCSKPLAYPKGNLQVWHLTRGGFAGGAADADALLSIAKAKTEPGDAGASSPVSTGEAAIKSEVKTEAVVKSEEAEPRGKKRGRSA